MNALIHINRNVLKSLGETKVIFLTQIIITAIGLGGVTWLLRYDINTLIIWIVCVSYLNWITISIFAGRKIGYSLLKQLKDVSLNIVFAVIAGLISYFIGSLVTNIIIKTIVGALLYALIYFVLHYIFKTKQLKTLRASIN